MESVQKKCVISIKFKADLWGSGKCKKTIENDLKNYIDVVRIERNVSENCKRIVWAVFKFYIFDAFSWTYKNRKKVGWNEDFDNFLENQKNVEK